MAYNNVFPMNYQQQYYPQYQQPIQQPVQQNNGIIWVQGEAGAKSYLVAPNTTVQLWDSEKQVIYLKSADASGMPNMKVLDYTIRNAETHPIPVTTDIEYVTKEEFSSFAEKIQSQIDKLPTKKEVKKND
jgi:predicted transcriptional regulator